MAKKQDATTDEFAITLDEFLGLSRGNVEIKKAFAMQMKSENNTAHRLKAEWAELYELFLSKPTAVSWKEWSEKKGGR